MPSFADHFRSFAGYNAWANERLYAAAAALPPERVAARREAAYFDSILGTLNHLLVADRLWLDRIEHLPPANLALGDMLHADLAELHAARRAEDARIAGLVESLRDEDLDRPVAYKTSKGVACADPLGRLLTHLFNHQTHHRGQTHALLKDAGADPPPLDYIFYMRESGASG